MLMCHSKDQVVKSKLEHTSICTCTGSTTSSCMCTNECWQHTLYLIFCLLCNLLTSDLICYQLSCCRYRYTGVSTRKMYKKSIQSPIKQDLKALAPNWLLVLRVMAIPGAVLLVLLRLFCSNQQEEVISHVHGNTANSTVNLECATVSLLWYSSSSYRDAYLTW